MTYFDLWDIARNPNTLPETLAVLSTNESWMVRWRVASNPSTPIETLKILATDADGRVRMLVWGNRNTTEEILMMVKAKNYQVRKPLLQLAQ